MKHKCITMNDFTKQYLHYGGFCGECGEALEPVLNEDYEKFGLCECPMTEIGGSTT